MSVHLQREIEKLKKKLLAESALVQEAIEKAVKSLTDRDAKLAEHVVLADYEIDQMEVEIEEDCLKIMALYGPVANDLRYVVAVLKINNDLERMADQAVNIAERAKFLACQERIEIPPELSALVDVSRRMLKKALQALIQVDAALARQIIQEDDQADQIHRRMYELVQGKMKTHPEQIECQINLISISRNLERIADLITNIAEDIIYLAEGQLIRHTY